MSPMCQALFSALDIDLWWVKSRKIPPFIELTLWLGVLVPHSHRATGL